MKNRHFLLEISVHFYEKVLLDYDLGWISSETFAWHYTASPPHSQPEIFIPRGMYKENTKKFDPKQ